MRKNRCLGFAGQLTLLFLFIESITANDEPLGRNYRKSVGSLLSNAHNNGKIPSGAESKVTAVSLRPGHLSGLTASGASTTSLDQLKTSASDNKDSFSIGLGVLSPSYSQKFGEDGKTKLDFNSDQGGFSYSLTNVVHPSPNNQAAAASLPAAASPIASKVQSEGFVPSAYYNAPSSQSNPQVNIYHKQNTDQNGAIYGRLAENSQYPAPPSVSAAPAASSASAAAAYGAAQQAAFGYNPYQAAAAAQPATQAAPANPLSSYPSFASGLTDAEKSFLQTVPQNPNQTPGASPYAGGQYSAPSSGQYPVSPSAYGSPYGNPAAGYSGQHVHNPGAYSPSAVPAAPAAASAYPSYPGQQSAAASSTQPKLVSQQQLTANPNPSNVIHSASPFSGAGGYPGGAEAGYPGAAGVGYPGGASANDPYLNQYMAAAASMYNPAYASMGSSASSAYPSMSPYDFMNDFMM